MKKALIYLDSRNIKHSAQLLGVIKNIYRSEEIRTYAAVFGEEDVGEIQGVFDELHKFLVPDAHVYDIRLMASCLENLYHQEQFSCIVIPATSNGRMIAPILSVKLKTGLVADVTQVKVHDGVIQMVRPAFDGKLMAGIINQDTEIVLMSARLGAFQYDVLPVKDTEISVHMMEPETESPIRLLAKSGKKLSGDIREAEVLVSGGGGVMENFSSLKRLAEPLHAMVASSRRLVDNGITPRSIQVGQSGKIVSPRLYMALGIYGSLQHIEGLNDVEYIISVNINKNAPICSLSSIVVEGDALEFIDKLLNKIKQNDN